MSVYGTMVLSLQYLVIAEIHTPLIAYCVGSYVLLSCRLVRPVRRTFHPTRFEGAMPDEEVALIAPDVPVLTPEQMDDYQRQIVVLMSLCLIEMLNGRKFDKKDMAKDLNKLTQIFAMNYSREALLEESK